MTILSQIMEAFRESKGVKKVMVVAVPIILIFNIVTGITVISVIINDANNNPTSIQDNLEVFKQSLEILLQTYEDVYKDVQSTRKNTEMKARPTPSLEFLSLLKPVVHLSGPDFDGSATGNAQRSSVIRNWAVSEGSERNLMYNGMMYEHGSITVPATGVYFIYSHVIFSVEDSEVLNKQRVFHHSIFMYNASGMYEVLLLYNKVTECKECTNDGAHLQYPSNINSIVYLNAGDQITLKVSHFNLFKHIQECQYTCMHIGAYML